MHLDRFCKTDRLSDQALDPRPQGQMVPLALLRITLARLMLLCLDMSRVRAPRVRIIFRDPKGLHQGLELPKHVGQALATAVSYRMPQPTRCFFPPYA